jgi:hypothetical protein
VLLTVFVKTGTSDRSETISIQQGRLLKINLNLFYDKIFKQNLLIYFSRQPKLIEIVFQVCLLQWLPSKVRRRRWCCRWEVRATTRKSSVDSSTTKPLERSLWTTRYSICTITTLMAWYTHISDTIDNWMNATLDIN